MYRRRDRVESRDKSQETCAGRAETSKINCNISDSSFCERAKSSRARDILFAIYQAGYHDTYPLFAGLMGIARAAMDATRLSVNVGSFSAGCN